jgi:ParB-like chromosome segregation protein Spo0J
MSAFEGEIHPLADRWQMLPSEELAALAENISSNGQHEPITLCADGLLVDGRNRLAACELAGIEPTFITNPDLDDDVKIAAFINAKNAHRRNVTTGQKAMAVAEQLAAEGKRKNGRWARGSIVGNPQVSKSGWVDAMATAGLVLDWTPELASEVIAGQITLNEAATEAETERDTELREREAERLRKEQIKDLNTNRPDLAKRVDKGELALDEALTLRDKETEAERKEQQRQDELAAKFSRDVAFSINCLAPLAHYDDRREQVRTGLRLDASVPITAELIAEAIESLNYIADVHKENL